MYMSVVLLAVQPVHQDGCQPGISVGRGMIEAVDIVLGCLLFCNLIFHAHLQHPLQAMQPGSMDVLKALQRTYLADSAMIHQPPT
jgi:hypothetical protein